MTESGFRMIGIRNLKKLVSHKTEDFQLSMQ